MEQNCHRSKLTVFRAGVNLVALDVTVVDRSGAPIKGLTADTFNVRIDGQPRPVRTLDYIEYGAGAGTVSSAATTSNTATGATRASQGGRVIVILFDDLSLKAGDAEGLTIAAERMLSALDDDDLVGLTTTSGMGPVVSPTRDRAAIIAALRSKKLVGSYLDLAAPHFITVKEAVEIEEDRRDALLRSSIANVPRADRSSCRDDSRWPCVDSRRGAFRRDGVAAGGDETEMIGATARAPKPRVVIALSSGLSLGTNRTYTEELEPITRAAAERGGAVLALCRSG